MPLHNQTSPSGEISFLIKPKIVKNTKLPITTKIKKNYLFFSFEKLTIKKQKKEVKKYGNKKHKKKFRK